jgi:hypothetical protein
VFLDWETSYAPPATVKPQVLQDQIPADILTSFMLEHDGHSFFDLSKRWTLE